MKTVKLKNLIKITFQFSYRLKLLIDHSLSYRTYKLSPNYLNEYLHQDLHFIDHNHKLKRNF